MTDSLYPASSPEIAEKRRALAPETEKAFQAFSKQVSQVARCPRKPSRSLPSPLPT